MIYALDPTTKYRIMAEPGVDGVCPTCRRQLIPHCGEILRWHWAHKSDDCDGWSEGETDWHWDWKQEVPESHREVVMGPHRADAIGRRGTVVEFQHSSISPEDVHEREDFYGTRMLWVVDLSEVEVGPFNSESRFWLEEGELYVRFYLKRTPAWLATSHRPLFLDLGTRGLIHVADFRESGWGMGFPLSRQDFIDQYLLDNSYVLEEFHNKAASE